MKNFLNQEVEKGSVVYRGERQGSHGRLIGIVEIDYGDGDAWVQWNFELMTHWEPTKRRETLRAFGLVVLDGDVLASIRKDRNEE